MFKWANSTFGQTNESWFFYEVYSKTTFSFPTPKHPQELLNEYQHHFSMSSRVGLHMTSERQTPTRTGLSTRAFIHRINQQK